MYFFIIFLVPCIVSKLDFPSPEVGWERERRKLVSVETDSARIGAGKRDSFHNSHTSSQLVVNRTLGRLTSR